MALARDRQAPPQGPHGPVPRGEAHQGPGFQSLAARLQVRSILRARATRIERMALARDRKARAGQAHSQQPTAPAPEPTTRRQRPHGDVRANHGGRTPFAAHRETSGAQTRTGPLRITRVTMRGEQSPRPDTPGSIPQAAPIPGEVAKAANNPHRRRPHGDGHGRTRGCSLRGVLMGSMRGEQSPRADTPGSIPRAAPIPGRGGEGTTARFNPSRRAFNRTQRRSAAARSTPSERAGRQATRHGNSTRAPCEGRYAQCTL